jgi:hypothetical protein
MISSFDGLNASIHPANSASRILETQNLMSLCSYFNINLDFQKEIK